jgi:hypothetical protein
VKISASTILVIYLLFIVEFVFDPFEIAADQIYRGIGALGTGLLILTYGVVSTVRGRFAWSGHMNAALDGRRDIFWAYVIHYNAIGICGTLFGLYELGVFGS